MTDLLASTPRLWPFLFALLAASGGLTVAQVMPQVDRHAWFVPVAGAAVPPPGSVRVWRNGVPSEPSTPYLLACDSVELINKSKTVLIQLADARLLVLSISSPERRVQVPCAQRPVLERVAETIRAFSGARDSYATRTAAMATRGGGVAPLALPLMDPAELYVSSSRAVLHVHWQGGLPPFELILADEDKGDSLQQLRGVEGRQAAIQLPRERPSSLRVAIRSVKDDEIWLTGIRLVPEQNVPREPIEFAAIPDQDLRRFLYADFLASAHGGAWALEALQLMQELAPRSEAARDWLATFGGTVR